MNWFWFLFWIGMAWWIMTAFADHSQDAIEREMRRPLVPVKARKHLEDNAKLGMIIVAIIVFVLVAGLWVVK